MLKNRLLKQNITFTTRPEVIDFLASQGWDPQFGARPLKRAIQELLEVPLSRGLLDGTFRGLVTAQLQSGKIEFSAH